MFGFILAVFVSVVCADCRDYPSEQTCIYYGRTKPLDCVYNGSAGAFACQAKTLIPSCSDYVANQTYCENNNGELNCAWDWDATGDKCTSTGIYDCEYYNLSTSGACTTNNGKFDCVYDESDKSCKEKACSGYDAEAGCNARDDCLFVDGACKSVFCSNYSESEAVCYGNPKGLSCIYDTTCQQANYCSSFPEATCDTNNGKLECYWDPSGLGSNKCTSKAQCRYFTTKDTCYSNNGALDCEWLSSTSKCNTFTCLSINNGLLDDAIPESACVTAHPTECRWEDGKCTSGAIAMSVPSLIMLLLLLLGVFSS